MLFSVSGEESGEIGFVNLTCSSTVIVASYFGTPSLSTGQSALEKQSILSLGQTAIFSKSSPLPGLDGLNLFSYDAGIDFLRIREAEIKYDLIVSSNTNRSPPLLIS